MPSETRSFAGGMASVAASDEAESLVTRSHEPTATARHVFNVVLNSGHFRVSRNHQVDERRVSGHQLLYCVNGSGYVVSGGRRFRLEPFQFAWLSGFSAHGANENAPWEVLWMRVEGSQMEKAWAALSVQERPVFEGLPQRETCKVFHDVNGLLANRPSTADSALNCRIAQLLGYLMESREAKKPPGRQDIFIDYPQLRSVLDQMAADPKRSWRAGELARLCGLSERNFFRRFKQATGFSPINWLRRERLSFAQAKLLESGSSIKQIADQAGYNDAFFFSRDFKRLTGSCPSEYRRARSWAANGEDARYLSYR
ncbi:MAG: AraC family transcriptional regulator [Terrimicrobiaceae bacterium]